jgi:NitT/TauT family transport system substrate-binding protein
MAVLLAPFLSFGPYFIAEEEGFFAEQGFQIEFVKVSEAMALQAMARGEIDVWAGLSTLRILFQQIRIHIFEMGYRKLLLF